MSLIKVLVCSALSTFVKIIVGFIIIKLLAIAFGPSGVGLAGNLRQLLTILGVLSGGGIFNGVTKYVAEYSKDKIKLYAVLGTASSIVFIFSIFLAIIFLLINNFISILIFNNEDYSSVICIVAVIQIGIAYSNFFLAILKGYRDISGNTQSVIISSLLGITIYYLFYKLCNYKWLLTGLTFIPSLVVLPAILIIIRRKYFELSAFKLSWNKQVVIDLSKFTVMSILTSVTLPVAYIMIRNLLAECYGWNEAGLWSAINSISDVYLQFVTTSFSVYLLSTFSRLKYKNEISKEIIKTLKYVLPIVAAIGFIIWLFRDFIILLLFSEKFIKMRDLFALQLVGDILKIGSYVFGYLIIAKAALFFYFATELSQFILLTSFSRYLINIHGLLGAMQAYVITYIIYFVFCCCVFFIYRRKI